MERNRSIPEIEHLVKELHGDLIGLPGASCLVTGSDGVTRSIGERVDLLRRAVFSLSSPNGNLPGKGRRG